MSGWDGVQYSISTSHHDGGTVQFESSSTGLLATLGAGVNDVSQQWSLHPSGDRWAYSIENWEYGTYIAEGETGIQSSFEPQTWFIVPQKDGACSYICDDAICSRVWAPLSQVDPSEAVSNYVGAVHLTEYIYSSHTVQVVLIPPTGADYELWELDAVGYATSGPTPTAGGTDTGPFTKSTLSYSTDPSDRPVKTIPGDLQALKSCTPCGSFHCTFTPTGDPISSMYSVLIGQPVANCNSGSQEPTTTKFGGTYELEQSFSVEVTSGAGLGFVGPSMSTAISAGNKTRIERAQEVEVTIRPGQIGALVANITYATTPGDVRVDRSTLAFVSVQPENVLGYSVVYTDCNSKFQALTLPKVECSGSGPRFGMMPEVTMYLRLATVLGIATVLL